MMNNRKISSKNDVRHLGVLVGSKTADRIIAVSTLSVFEDSSLLQTFWDLENTSIDSGFQGHIYTRFNDILIVHVPYQDDSILKLVTKSIDINYQIWKSLTGIELSSAASRIILTSPKSGQYKERLLENITWYIGSLLDAAVNRHLKNGEALLAFVLNNRLTKILQQASPEFIFLNEQCQITSFLMDKNNAMQVLQDNGVCCAKTYLFNEGTDMDSFLYQIPDSINYIFKPAGGAAGIGVFGNIEGGVGIELISKHLAELKQKSKLPVRFQIQEFLSGKPQGYTAYMNKDGTFEVLEIHEQFINEAGRFIGGRWTLPNQTTQMETAVMLYKQLAAIQKPRFWGLICLDIIDGKIIEINPRLTASAPIAHFLQKQSKLSKKLGQGFQIKQIDINTGVQIPYESISNGTLQQIIEYVWKENNVLALPQGLNPFGNSRLIFINDDEVSTAQKAFIQRLKNS